MAALGYMAVRYKLQMLDGYTDGHESWLTVGSYHTRAEAEVARTASVPDRKYRIRARWKRIGSGRGIMAGPGR
jgi:hypothetical protein